MDTALQAVNKFPSQEVHMLTGNGTVFFNRNEMYPKGLKRYFGGTLGTNILVKTSMKFNGTNEKETFDYFLKTYGLSLNTHPRNNYWGILSEEELSVISQNVESIYNDYLEDVIDGDSSPVMKLRSGENIPIENGSWFINCTGFLFKQRPPYDPYLSKQGKILSIQQTSETFFLSRLSAYFLPHLWFLDKLKDLPLYQVNYVELSRKNRQALPFIGMSHILYNLITTADVLPLKIIQDCPGVGDKWYPLYRSLFFNRKLMKDKNKYLNHWQKCLDVIREKYGINCGVLET